MYSNRVEICGIDTSKLPLLSSKEKKELLEKAVNGDIDAREKFIFSNLRLVLSLIQKYIHRADKSNIDDIFQVGCIGLIKALDNFDLSQGVQFSTYACPMIIGEIKRFLRDNSPIRISRSIRETAFKALEEKEKLTRTLNREPTIEEIGEGLNMSKKDVAYALESIVTPISLYEPIFNDNGDSMFVLEQIKDDKNTDALWIENMSIKEGIENLNFKEKEIINLRYFIGRTQCEVAEEIGISQAQVSRLEKVALKNIKKYLN
ncbi:MAG: RNA polymerase sporulation sigma factor SigG [Lachnospirales bacterium]